jgi:hypothetical protein
MTAGGDALALMRRRVARMRKEASREIDALRPATQSRFDGVERIPGDDDAQNAVARLTAFVALMDQADEALT